MVQARKEVTCPRYEMLLKRGGRAHLLGLTGVDHEAVVELHGLGTLSTELARDDNFATLGTALHDESENTVAGAETNVSKEA